jgi:hypothetical protein
MQSNDCAISIVISNTQLARTGACEPQAANTSIKKPMCALKKGALALFPIDSLLRHA